MSREKTAISREEEIFMREAERLFRKENISPPKFQHLDIHASLDEIPRMSEFTRFKDLDTIEEASTPLSSNTNILFSTHQELRLPNPRDTVHETNPITEDLTTILSSDNRMPYNSKPAFTLSTGANFSPREIQTPQEYDRAMIQKSREREEDKLDEFIEDKSGPLGFTFSNKKMSQLRREGELGDEDHRKENNEEDEIQLEPMQEIGTIPMNSVESTELENLVELEDNMKESDISDILDQRCKAGKYFTYAGPVLIAMNPRDPVLKNDFFSPFKLHEYGYQNKKEGSLKPHLYSVTLSAYSAMLSEQKNQVITLLGQKGTGKSQLMRYALEHLFRVNGKASRDMIASRLQETTAALDILSIMTGHTVVEKKGIFTYDTAAFVIKVLYEPEGLPAGCQISCKLLDCTLPKAKFARSFDALHALFHTPSRRILQNLGIGALDPSHLKLFYGSCTAEDERVITSADRALQEHDSTQWKRLIECFDILEFTQQEIYTVLDILAIIILISEQKVAVRTKAPVKQWKQVQASVHKGGMFNKLQKLLGMSETKFNQYFSQKNQKELWRQLRTLQRHLYAILVEYLVNLLNFKLQSRFNIEECLEIALINFPGFKHRGQNTLGGFVSNMASESLNYYCSQQFMKMIQQLNQEALGVRCLRAPLSKDAIQFLLQSQNGLVFKLQRMTKQSLIAYLRREEERQEGLNQQDEEDGSLKKGKLFHLAGDADTLTVRFTFGNATYSLNKLRNNIADFNRFSKIIFQALKNHSNHALFKSMQKYLQGQLNSFANFASPPASLNDSRSSFASNRSKTTGAVNIFSSTISDQLSPLLNDYLGCTPFIIYCFHTLNSLPCNNYTPFIEQPSFLQVDISDVNSLARHEASLSTEEFQNRLRGMPKCIVARAIRNTLIHPILIWECYGFPDWIALQQFSQDFSRLLLQTRRQEISDQMFSTLSPRQRAYAILSCFAEPLHFMVGSQHVLLKPGLLSHLQSLMRNQKKAYAMRFQALPGNPKDYVEALRRMISQDYGKVFSPLNYSWNPFEYDLELNEEPLSSVAKVAIKIEQKRKKSKEEYRSSFETAGSKITPPSASQKPSQGVISNSGYSSLSYISGALTPKRTKKQQKQKLPGYRECGKSPKNKSPKKKKQELESMVQSEQSTGTIKELMLSTLQHKEIRKIVSQVVETPAYLKKYVDYTRKMSEIVKIQSWFRGTLVRKRKRWLDFAHYCACTIQRHWKGFKARKFYLFVQLRKYAAIAVQRRYRLHYYRRVKAAKKIQHFYLKHLEKKILPLQNEHLDAEIARYEKMTKDVLGDVLHTEKTKRTHYLSSLSPSKKGRVNARMAANDLEGIDREIAREIADQKAETKAVHAFKPTINEKSRKIVMQKRKQLQRSGRQMEREYFRTTLHKSSSTTSNNKSDRSFSSKNKIHLIPTTIDVGEGLSRNQGVKGVPTAPSQVSPKNEKLLNEFIPPRELDALGRTESVAGFEGGRERSLGDRLRLKLMEKQEEEKVERKKKQKKSDFNGFLMRQEQMEQKRKSRAMQKKQMEQGELRECSWSPVISRNAKKLNRNYTDLSQWNKKKEKQLQDKRKQKEKEKELKVQDFKASKNSERILKRAEKRFASQIDSSKEQPSSVSMLTQRELPIWPMKFQKEDAAKSQLSQKRVFIEGEGDKLESSSFMVLDMSDAGISADSELMRIQGLLK